MGGARFIDHLSPSIVGGPVEDLMIVRILFEGGKVLVQ